MSLHNTSAATPFLPQFNQLQKKLEKKSGNTTRSVSLSTSPAGTMAVTSQPPVSTLEY